MRRVLAAYAGLGVVLWPLPLLNVLQVESAAVGAFASFFIAGWAAVTAFRSNGAAVWSVVARQEAALLVLLAMLTVSQLWAPNCTFGQGLLFFGLFPGVTVLFAVGIAYALTGLEVSRPFLVLAGTGVLVSIAGPIYDLGFHPQFYTYNHVFGGVLGPIYDEQLAVRPGLFAFRTLTLLWAGGGYLVGRWARGLGSGVGCAVCAVTIAGGYLFSPILGINTTQQRLQSALDGHVRTRHFDIYYEAGSLDSSAVAALADDHEAYYRHLRRRLDLSSGEGPDRIQSYLYPNPDVKARLTGARYTSVSPVWLQTPQVHLLADRADESLGHELAHVFSRTYGLPGLRASWAPGLIEGWAVALEPPDPAPSSHDLVRAATTSDTTAMLSLKADAVEGRLTPWGFWTGRGAVSYTTMGSFVRFLLDEYGPERLKAVYAYGNFEDVYGRPLSVLVREWTAFLDRQPMIAWSAREVVTQQFTRPSLFETECPHYLPPHRRHLHAAKRARRSGDSVGVDRHLRAALDAEPRYASAHAMLARRRLARGEPGAVVRQLDTLAGTYQTASLLLIRGDASVRQGKTEAGRRLYERVFARLPKHAHEQRARILLRIDARNRPETVRTLTNGEPPAEQARQLGQGMPGPTPAVRSWKAIRYADAHQFAQADSVWQDVSRAAFSDWVRSRRQEVGIQRRGWESTAAHRAGRFDAAARLAREGQRLAAAHGAQTWADTFRAWVQRAEWAGRTGGGE